MESALKMKEVTYLHAEGMPAGFLKHGTLSMIEESVHSLFFVPPPAEVDLHNRTIIAIEEIKTRGGTLVGLYFEGDSQAKSLLDHAVELPPVPFDCSFCSNDSGSDVCLLHRTRFKTQHRQAQEPRQIRHGRLIFL